MERIIMFKIGDIVRVNPDLSNDGNHPNPGTIGRVTKVYAATPTYATGVPHYHVRFYYSPRVQMTFRTDDYGYYGNNSPTPEGFFEANWSYSESSLELYEWGSEKKREISEEDRKFLEETKNKADLTPVEQFLIYAIEDVTDTKYTEEDFRV
jgi:hypothetical protein